MVLQFRESRKISRRDHLVPPRVIYQAALALMRQRKPSPNSDGGGVNTALSEATDAPAKVAEATNGTRHYIALAVLAVVTYFSIPDQTGAEKGQYAEVRRVWWFGLVTALSTGAGALPFLVVRDIPPFWVAVANGKSGAIE
jgi:hypothetical protein